jgi:hypothetical protein
VVAHVALELHGQVDRVRHAVDGEVSVDGAAASSPLDAAAEGGGRELLDVEELGGT